MKKYYLLCALSFAALVSCNKTAGDKPYEIKFSWETPSPRVYEHFTDMGNYTILLNDRDVACDDSILAHQDEKIAVPSCTATAKLNSKGEVIMGRNMDIDVSQMPCYIQHLHGSKHDAVIFSYRGPSDKYRYDQMDEIDKDEQWVMSIASGVSDAMNDAGLYLETNIRERDTDYHMDCEGVFPGKKKVCFSMLATLVALNCSTVDEALEYIRNSYDWYGNETHLFAEPYRLNICFMIGDATGNFGLIEFGDNQMHYLPYSPGQANYYMTPALAEYANSGSGFGRLSKALEGLPKCETEQDMMDNMLRNAWRGELLHPGSMGYSDMETSLAVRRATPKDTLQARLEAQLAPIQPLAEQYYKGNEKPLRDNGTVWTSSFNFGVNCHTKHLRLRLWEREDCVIDLQWK